MNDCTERIMTRHGRSVLWRFRWGLVRPPFVPRGCCRWWSSGDVWSTTTGLGAPPTTVSSPCWAEKRSSPVPPSMRSPPVPPQCTSLPVPPRSTSSPVPPKIWSLPSPPTLGDVVTGVAVEAVIAFFAFQAVVLCAAAEQVGVVASHKRVLSGSAEEAVPATAALKAVAPPSPMSSKRWSGRPLPTASQCAKQTTHAVFLEGLRRSVESTTGAVAVGRWG